jgi:hypothetical protein
VDLTPWSSDEGSCEADSERSSSWSVGAPRSPLAARANFARLEVGSARVVDLEAAGSARVDLEAAGSARADLEVACSVRIDLEGARTDLEEPAGSMREDLAAAEGSAPPVDLEGTGSAPDNLEAATAAEGGLG